MAEELAGDKEVRGSRDNPFSKTDANGEERGRAVLVEADHSCIGSKVMIKMTQTTMKISQGKISGNRHTQILHS